MLKKPDKELVLAPIIKHLTRMFEYYFHKQKLMFMDKFDSLRDEFPNLQEAYKLKETSIPDWFAFWDYIATMSVGLIIGEIDAAVRLSMVKAGLVEIGTANIAASFTLANPAAVEYLNQYGARLVAGINNTTKEGLRTLISKATDEGWSYSKTSKEIRSMFDGFSERKPQLHIRNRAEGIAVTECGNAYEEAQFIQAQGLQMAGLPMEKHWLITGGPVCDDCLANAEAGWIPLDQPYPSGHLRPLAHPYCRCSEEVRWARERD